MYNNIFTYLKENNINIISIRINVYSYANNILVTNKWRCFLMNHNDSIGCVVGECKFHCTDDNYCTLNKIEVVKHESVAKTPECTDCASFKSMK